MGEYKWIELGYDYDLDDIKAPDEKLINDIKNIFQQHKLIVE